MTTWLKIHLTIPRHDLIATPLIFSRRKSFACCKGSGLSYSKIEYIEWYCKQHCILPVANELMRLFINSAEMKSHPWTWPHQHIEQLSRMPTWLKIHLTIPRHDLIATQLIFYRRKTFTCCKCSGLSYSKIEYIEWYCRQHCILKVDLDFCCDVIWWHRFSTFCPGNGFVPSGTMPLPELMLTNYQWGLVVFSRAI